MNDELDIEEPLALVGYLRRTGRIGADETPSMRPLVGGVSNRTVWVERENGDGWVLKQALAKLRVQVDWFSSPERVHREALGLRTLGQLAPPGAIPRLIFEDHATHLIAMEAVAQPHSNWKELLLAGRLEDGHIVQFGRLLATIHRKAFERRHEFAPQFADRTFFETLRLEPYYGYAASQTPAAQPFLTDLIDATRRRTLTLVHGDYSPKNVLVHDDRLVLLDHEVIHWGDPAFDLGFSLTHLLSKAHHLPEHRSQFAAAALRYWQTYRRELGQPDWSDDLEPFAARHTLACLLARVDGRSPLEYLDDSERSRQRRAVLHLIASPLQDVEQLIGRFTEQIEESST